MDQIFTNSQSLMNQEIPIINSSTHPIKPKGSIAIAYDILTNNLIISTGLEWKSVVVLPNNDNGTQFQNIQDQSKTNSNLSFIVHNLYNQVLSGSPFPTFPTG